MCDEDWASYHYEYFGDDEDFDDDLIEVVTVGEVMKYGTVISQHPCDVNPFTGETEANAGTEYEIEYKGRRYLITDASNKSAIAEPVDDDFIDDDED